VLRSAQFSEPLDQTVVMVALDGAPALSQWRPPSRSGVVVVVVWPSDEAAVTLPGVLLGSTLIV